jgi:conserved oligomeric Golgi complex subunit 1
MIKQESTDGPLELQLALPLMPSLYVISFLYLACLEIHRIGGHILDRVILQKFSWELLDKVFILISYYVIPSYTSLFYLFFFSLYNFSILQQVVKIYENFESTESSKSRVSEKGLLQILLDLRFIGDILSGGKNPLSTDSDTSPKQDKLSQATVMKAPFRRRQSVFHSDSPTAVPVLKLINKFSARLDPIDWAM